MTDRDAPTIPPPPEPFREPAMVHDTEPPISPAQAAAYRAILREELGNFFAPFAKQWGESHVALDSKIDRVAEEAANAISLANDALRLGTERERKSLDYVTSIHEDIREVRTFLSLPEFVPASPGDSNRTIRDLQNEEERVG
jgi:hypothetical protein